MFFCGIFFMNKTSEKEKNPQTNFSNQMRWKSNEDKTPAYLSNLP